METPRVTMFGLQYLLCPHSPNSAAKKQKKQVNGMANGMVNHGHALSHAGSMVQVAESSNWEAHAGATMLFAIDRP